jgi:hypothetical protein
LHHVSALQGHLQAIGEQLPEDGLVRPKHIAVKCDFYDIKIKEKL